MYQWVGEPVHSGENRVFYRAVQLPTQLCRTQDFLLLAERGEHRMRLGKCVAFWQEAGDEKQPAQQWLRILRYRYRDELPATDSSAADALMKLATGHCVEVVQTAEREDYLVDQIVGKAAVIHAPNMQDLHSMVIPEEPTYICHYQLSPDTHSLGPVQRSAGKKLAKAKRKTIEEEGEEWVESLSPPKRSYACSSLPLDNSYQSDPPTSPHRQLLSSSTTLSENLPALTSTTPSTPFEQTGFDEEKQSTPAEQVPSKTRRSAFSWPRMLSELENAPSRKRPRRECALLACTRRAFFSQSRFSHVGSCATRGSARSPGIRIGPEYQADIPPLLPPNARDESEIKAPKAAKVWSREDNLLPHLETFLTTVKSNQSVLLGDAVYIFDDKKGHWIAGIIKRAAQKPRPFDKVAVFDGTTRHEVYFCDCVLPTQQELALHFFHMTKGKSALALQLFRSARKKSLQQSWTEREVLAFADLYERFRDNLHRVHIGLQGIGSLRSLREVVVFHHTVFLTSLHADLITRRPLAHEYDAQQFEGYLRKPPPSTGSPEYSSTPTIATTSTATSSASSSPASSAATSTTAADTRSGASKAAPAAATTEVASGRMTTRSQASKAAAVPSTAVPAAAAPPAAAPPAAAPASRASNDSDDDDAEIYSLSGDESEDANEEAAERAVNDESHEPPASAHEAESHPSSAELVSTSPQAYAARPGPSLGGFITAVRTTLPKVRSDLLISIIIACGVGRISFVQMTANATAILRAYPQLYEQFHELITLQPVHHGGS